MTLADAAEAVLKEAKGGPLDCRQIADRAVSQGLAKPKSDEPWTYFRAAIRKDNKSRQEKGLAPRFVSAGVGSYRLAN